MNKKNDNFIDKKIHIVDRISKSNSESLLGKSLDIEVRIFKTKGNIVTFGINASKDISIFREEVYKKFQRDRKIEQERNS